MSIKLDELVHKKVFGRRIKLHTPKYSTSLSATWKIVDKMLAQGWEMELELYKTKEGDPRCRVRFEESGKPGSGAGALSTSAAVAICEAAIGCLGAPVGD